MSREETRWPRFLTVACGQSSMGQKVSQCLLALAAIPISHRFGENRHFTSRAENLFVRDALLCDAGLPRCNSHHERRCGGGGDAIAHPTWEVRPPLTGRL